MSSLPNGMKFVSDLPTKLEADDKFIVEVEAQRLDVSRDELVQQYGNLLHVSGQLFGELFSKISFQLSFKNKYGGRFYQMFQIVGGQIASQVSWRKIKNP